MKTGRFEIGEKVGIVPHEGHLASVKRHYDKVVNIVGIKIDSSGNFYYKIRGIAGYARDRDLEKL